MHLDSLLRLPLFLPLHFPQNGDFGARFRWNPFDFSTPSPFSTRRYLLLTLARIRFRMNGGFGARVRRNRFGVSALSSIRSPAVRAAGVIMTVSFQGPIVARIAKVAFK
jgi:hypothetical protein